MMRILAFLVVWGKKVGRSFALCHRTRLTLVPKYTRVKGTPDSVGALTMVGISLNTEIENDVLF